LQQEIISYCNKKNCIKKKSFGHILKKKISPSENVKFYRQRIRSFLIEREYRLSNFLGVKPCLTKVNLTLTNLQAHMGTDVGIDTPPT